MPNLYATIACSENGRARYLAYQSDKAAAKAPQAGALYVLNQVWKAGDVVKLRLPMAVRAVPDHLQSASVERGPLVYGLKLGEQ